MQRLRAADETTGGTTFRRTQTHNIKVLCEDFSAEYAIYSDSIRFDEFDKNLQYSCPIKIILIFDYDLKIKRSPVK